MKFQIISDTHGQHQKVEIDETVDMIIHAGDESNYYAVYQNEVEFMDFIDWYSQLPIEKKILVPGNHSAFIASNEAYCKKLCSEKGIDLLIFEELEYKGFKIFGNPWTPVFHNWYYNNDERGLERIFSVIEDKSYDIFISHGPPAGILSFNTRGQDCGSVAMKKYIDKTGPLYCLFGHIHEAYGIQKSGCTTYVNASFVDETYRNFNKKPLVFELY